MSKVVTEFLGQLLLAFADLPAVDDDIASVNIAIDVERAEAEFVEMHMHLLGRGGHALFFDVMTEKAAQRCSTLWLPQCGQVIFSFSCAAIVKIFEKVFLQA